MNRPTCSTCPYYEMEYNTCRRYAPRPVTLTLDLDDRPLVNYAIEPKQSPDDWCGEHPLMDRWIESGGWLNEQGHKELLLPEYWKRLGVVGKPNITLCRLGIDTVEKLMEAIATKQLQDLPGVGEVTVRYLEKWVKKYRRQKQGEVGL